MTPNYLSELFVKADTPYDTRDKCKLIQPLKRTLTYGLRSFQYYGAHVWNILPINIKAAQSLHELKSLIKSWPGPTCSYHICPFLVWLIIDWLIVFISIDATPIHVHWGRAVGVTTMLSLVAPRVVFMTACGAPGRCGVVTLTAPLCSSVYTLRIYAIILWQGPTCLCHLCSALLLLMTVWLIIFISTNATPKYVNWGRGCRCDDHDVAWGAAGCPCDSLRCRR